MLRLTLSGALAAGVLAAAGLVSPAAASPAAPPAVAARTALLGTPGDLRRVSLPFFWPNNYLYDVSAASPDSVWIAGTQGELVVPGPIPGTGRTIPGNPVVRRWKDGGWVEYPLGGLPSHATIIGVDAVAPEDVWISGTKHVTENSHQPYVARFTGSAFTQVALPPGTTAAHVQADASGVWLSTATDLYRWTDGTWAHLTALPELRWQHTLRVRSADDIWLFGEVSDYSDTLEAAHWDGTSWTRSTLHQPGRFGTITDVLPLPSGEAWAVGVNWSDGGGRPILLHWDGTAWESVPVPAGLNSLGSIVRAPDGTLWANGHAGDQPAAPGLIRYRGGAWERVPTPAVPNRSNVHVDALTVDPVSGALWTLGTVNIGGPVLLSDR
ncbi:hypothetical protein [Actinomadura rugatobispora]|uniref:Exo-alpha-sialidase n=1 Tax=Actinomadura rugatobispora TaxID=1994 RepID=A0ABW0ZRF7_9ACTN|nr:hypothetical protein GCM10010200_022980 [Actinomadura rugatobispora]